MTKPQIIRLVETAQALAAFYLEKPAVAKSKTSALFIASSDGGYYEEIFNAETTPERIIGAVMLMRKMTEKQKDVMATNPDERLSWLPHADYFLVSLFHHRFLDVSRQNEPAYIDTFFKTVQSRFEELYWGTVNQVIDYMDRRPTEAGYSHPKFFKTQTSYEELARQFVKTPIAT